MKAADFTITFHDQRHDTDDEIAERVAYLDRLRQELLPDDPPTSVEQAIAANRASPEHIRRLSFRARDPEGALVGNASTSIDPDDDNPDVLMAGINVLPEWRRKGLASLLLGELVGLAEREGKTRLIGQTFGAIESGRHFASAAGAVAKQEWHLNHLPISDVDRPMLERWVVEAADRSADYELIGWDGPVPDEYLAEWIDIVLVMNTAPLDDLEINDFTLTPEEVRDEEKIYEATGSEHWVLAARHRATGAWAGFHDVTWNPTQPPYVWVGATGVRPEHRGHALGKWLKAAMTLRILDERPEVESIRTGNADSNDAMLGINKAMGYRALIAETTWELPVTTAKAWLDQRTALGRD